MADENLISDIVLVRRDQDGYVEITAWAPVTEEQDYLRIALMPGGKMYGKLGSEIPGAHVFGLNGDDSEELDPRTSAAADWYDLCRRNAIDAIYKQAPELARSNRVVEVGSQVHYYTAG